MVSTPKCSPKSSCSRVAAVRQGELLVDGQVAACVVRGEGHGLSVMMRSDQVVGVDGCVRG